MKSASEFEYELELVCNCLDVKIEPEITQLIDRSRCLAWIASGLSKAAAESGRRALQDTASIPGILMTPLDYCSGNRSVYLPVLVSYRGKNHDILSAARSVVGSRAREVILISGYCDTPVRAYLEQNGVKVHLISLPKHREDKRFVAVLATWGLAGLSLGLAQAMAGPGGNRRTLLRAAYESAEKKSKAATEQFLEVERWDSRKWIILGGANAVPAMLAWEAMLGEGAIMSAALGDIKDYTHGRYLSAMRERSAAFLILTDSSSRNLGEIVGNRFASCFPTVAVDTSFEGADPFPSTCEHLFLPAFVVSGLAQSLGHTICKPPKPREVHDWRNWGQIRTV
jgi:hypothetical protein